MNAFDVLAPTYDRDFTESPIAQHLRQVTHERLRPLVRAGDTVLELGSGTGEDARVIARMGAVLTCTDASRAMLTLTAHKTADLAVTATFLDLNALPEAGFQTLYQGVYANFGVLNCVADRSGLARWLAARVTAGGWLAFAVMPPLCLWETLWHALHGQFKTATRRWHVANFQPPDSERIRVWYPSPQRLVQDFAPWFTCEYYKPLGVALPHSGAYRVVEKRLTLLRWLMRLDTQLQEYAALALLADHYWIVLRRQP